MANFILEYYDLIDAITDKWKLRLVTYSLDGHEWELLGQLRDVLEVHVYLLSTK